MSRAQRLEVVRAQITEERARFVNDLRRRWAVPTLRACAEMSTLVEQGR